MAFAFVGVKIIASVFVGLDYRDTVADNNIGNWGLTLIDNTFYVVAVFVGNVKNVGRLRIGSVRLFRFWIIVFVAT